MWVYFSTPELANSGCPNSIPKTLASVREHFQTSPLKPLSQLTSNFIWRLLRMRERKFSKGPRHVTKMAAMPV